MTFTNTVYSDGTPCVTDGYNRLGQLTSVVCNGMTDTLTYNLAGQLLGESFSGGPLDGLSVTNGYDQYLRRTSLTLNSQPSTTNRTTYGYDAASRLQTVNDGHGDTVSYNYLANSPLVSQITFKQNSATRMTTTKQYDYLNRLTAISSQPGAAGVLPISFNYNYNSANQRTQDKLADGSYWVYQYDSLGQVISGIKYFSDNTPVPGQWAGYEFWRTFMIGVKHWQDVMDAWFNETGPNPVGFIGISDPRNADIAHNIGFIKSLDCWIAKKAGGPVTIPPGVGLVLTPTRVLDFSNSL